MDEDNIFYKTVAGADPAIESLSKNFATVIDRVLGIFDSNGVTALDFGTATAAIGVTLTTLFFCMAMFSEVAAFRVDRIEEAIRVAMKFIVAKIIIENTSWITGAIYSLFTGLSQDSITSGLADLAGSLTGITPSETGADPLGTGLGWLVQIFTQVIPALVIVIIVYATILLTVCGIVFEIGIHMAAAPIALSTLCNDMTRPTGISFIKSYSAVCLQAFILGACLTVYDIIYTQFQGITVTLSASGNLFTGLLKGLMPVIMVLSLSTIMKKSGEVTKRMLGV